MPAIVAPSSKLFLTIFLSCRRNPLYDCNYCCRPGKWKSVPGQFEITTNRIDMKSRLYVQKVILVRLTNVWLKIQMLDQCWRMMQGSSSLSLCTNGRAATNWILKIAPFTCTLAEFERVTLLTFSWIKSLLHVSLLLHFVSNCQFVFVKLVIVDIKWKVGCHHCAHLQNLLSLLDKSHQHFLGFMCHS